MAKIFVFFALFAFIGLEISTTAAEPIETVLNIYTCIRDDLTDFKNDVVEALKENPADAICGPNTLDDVNDRVVKIMKEAQKCKDLQCYIEMLPTFKSELYSVGMKCTDKIKQNGPHIISTRAYTTIAECIIKPLA